MNLIPLWAEGASANVLRVVLIDGSPDSGVILANDPSWAPTPWLVANVVRTKAGYQWRVVSDGSTYHPTRAEAAVHFKRRVGEVLG